MSLIVSLITSALIPALISAALSLVVAFHVSKYKINKQRQQERNDYIEDWLRKTASLSWMARFEIDRADDDIDIPDREGKTNFGGLEDTPQLSLADELMQDLFRHSSDAPHELYDEKIQEKGKTFPQLIKDCTKTYLEGEAPIEGDLDLESHKEEVINELNDIHNTAQNELVKLDRGIDESTIDMLNTWLSRS